MLGRPRLDKAFTVPAEGAGRTGSSWHTTYQDVINQSDHPLVKIIGIPFSVVDNAEEYLWGIIGGKALVKVSYISTKTATHTKNSNDAPKKPRRENSIESAEIFLYADYYPGQSPQLVGAKLTVAGPSTENSITWTLYASVKEVLESELEVSRDATEFSQRYSYVPGSSRPVKLRRGECCPWTAV